MVRLKSLVESLEKKYDLNESTTINEKFSDNVPDWFAKRVLTTKYSPSGRPRKRDMGGKAHFGPGESEYDYVTSGKGSKKSPHAGKDPEYKQSDYWSEDQSLFNKLRKRGISLDTLNVIEGPIPKDSTDARVKYPNIPILLFDNGVVYIPGMNDDEKLGGRKTLGAYDIDVLLGRCVKFAYIDGNDPNNFMGSERRIRRSTALPDKNFYRYGDKRVDREGDPIGDLGSWRTDKSGYHKIPPIERYKDQLNKIKASKIFDILQDIEDTLVDLQQEFSYYISSSSIKDYDYGTFDIINIRLDRAVNAYRGVYKNVEHIMNDPNLTDERKKEVLVNLVNGNYPYNGNGGGLPNLNTKMAELKEVTNDKFNATIDWI